MGDPVQYASIQEKRKELRGPVLEVGSKFYGNDVSFSYRELFEGEAFVGTDMLPGANVDVVCNLTDDFSVIDRTFGGQRFNTIICASVLEHCSNPFLVAQNLERLLGEGGVLFVGVPFSFPVHGYPNDYWRFTPDGVRTLFPHLDFDRISGSFNVGHHPERLSLSELNDYCLDFRTAKYRREKRYFVFLSAALLKVLGKLGIFGWITKFRFAFPVIQLNMFGVRKQPVSSV